jgi:hypothetical protein
MDAKKRLAGRCAITALSALSAVVVSGGGCESNNLVELPCEQDIYSYETFIAGSRGFKLDLLFTIDNSRSMADKQELLALAVPDLVEALVNPPCIDYQGEPAAVQPKGPLEVCPAGSRRSSAPLVDIHIGVISSSLGGHGADACPDVDDASCAPGVNLSNNDKGHLLTRRDPCESGDVPTYAGKGFLAWDPAALLAPPGEGDRSALAGSLKDMVTGAGQLGCGYEAQLESWYRFLVDPEPYASISVADNKAVPKGIDEVLLAQRADFLRPDSMVMIAMLSDENDCSIRESGQGFFAAKLKNENGSEFHLPRPRAECATDPNDPCCKSCGQDPGSCPPDPTCFDANGNIKVLTSFEDSSNLRCFDQKRRFGINFLYPTDRYTTALTSYTVPNRAGELVPNPLFTDLKPEDASSSVRGTGEVVLVGIVGVPWQDIARDPGDLSKGFKSGDELSTPDENGVTGWDIILGDPAVYQPPKDPHMIESIHPRSGTNPVTGDALVPPGQPGASPINGGEWTIKNEDDLQYACAFPLAKARDCSDPAIVSCDCKDPANDNPLCAEDPLKPGSRTLQVKAKAYPGVRELEVLKSLGWQGITASVCPANVTSPEAPDFAYRPVVKAILERLRSDTHNGCLERQLPTDGEGRAECKLIEARAVPEASCACDEAAGRRVIPEANAGLIRAILADPRAQANKVSCFCELVQLSNAGPNGEPTGELDACQGSLEMFPTDPSGAIVHGWCYVDATTTPPTGNPELVNACSEEYMRTLRFAGKGAPEQGAVLFMTCAEGCEPGSM